MTTDGRILIVDDDPDFVEAYRDLLGRDGYVVESAARPRDSSTRRSTARTR